MQHSIPLEQYGPQAASMADAIESCVHCGFCLPTCPTYVALGEEMDSPRGRILLMKEVLEGKIELENALPYVDNCLGCQACETACPSGVKYGELITPFRAYAEKHRERKPIDRLQRMVTLQTLPYPQRFRLAARFGRFARPLARVLPASIASMLQLLPDKLPASQPLPSFYPAQGERRARVALGRRARVGVGSQPTGRLPGHLNGVGVPELMWREPAPDPCRGCGAVQLRANAGRAAPTAARGSVQDAEERADRQCVAQLDPWLQLLPCPAVHPDLTAFPAFALAHEDRTANRIKVGLGERERFADPKSGAPQDDDERAEPDPVDIITCGAHDRDDLLDRRRIRRIAQALVVGRATLVEARERGRRSPPARTVQR